MIRDRIKELRRVPASELFASPKNWRTHPESQVKVLDGILGEIGYADALLARELPDGSLELIDGHCRRELTPDQVVPVLVVDLDEDEAAKLMTVLDPLAAMAETNKDALGKLLANVQTDSDALHAMLKGLSDPEQLAGELKQLSIKKPPAKTWCLIGVPTSQYQTIAESIEVISNTEGTIVEMTVNND